MTTYQIIRFHLNGDSTVIGRGLPLKVVQEHCRNPQTSSSTATSEYAEKYTKENGQWFDGYSEERE